jgi:hypothetical protein
MRFDAVDLVGFTKVFISFLNDKLSEVIFSVFVAVGETF